MYKFWLLILFLFCGLFGHSAKNLVPFTESMRQKHAWSDSEVKQLVFYISHDVILHREATKGATEIINGSVKTENERNVNEIIIKTGTKGVVIDIPKAGKLLVSFESGDDRYLSFGVNPTASDKYVLLASDWKNDMGKIHYGGEVYYTDVDSRFAYLLVDQNKVENVEVSKKVVKGRTPSSNVEQAKTNRRPDEVEPIVQQKAQTPKLFPLLTTNNFLFKDQNRDDRIQAGESVSLSFELINTGKGKSSGLKAILSEDNALPGFLYERQILLSDLDAGAKKTFTIPIGTTVNLPNGIAKFSIRFEETYGLQPDPIQLDVVTVGFKKPHVIVADHQFYSESGVLQKGIPVQLKFLVQNTGQGNAQQVNAACQFPAENVYATSDIRFTIGDLLPGESKEMVVDFVVSKNYTLSEIPITISLTEKNDKYAEGEKVLAKLNATSKSLQIVLRPQSMGDKQVEIIPASFSSEVDKNIPVSLVKITNAYALVIGNEDYTRYQTGLANEANVEFARNDATVFAQYAEKTLGIPSENIVLLTDAISSKMRAELERVVKMAALSKGEIYFYYAGHGLPDEATKVPYIIPVDIAGSDIAAAIKLSEVYNKLGSPGIQKATVFLDACFSGGGRNEGLVAARAVKIAPKADALPANVVVFAAASGTQMSLPYKEKQHGMFTYYLLKKLQESKGDITLSDLSDYLKQQVELQSLKANSMEQSPNILAGGGIIKRLDIEKIK